MGSERNSESPDRQRTTDEPIATSRRNNDNGISDAKRRAAGSPTSREVTNGHDDDKGSSRSRTRSVDEASRSRSRSRSKTPRRRSRSVSRKRHRRMRSFSGSRSRSRSRSPSRNRRRRDYSRSRSRDRYYRDSRRRRYSRSPRRPYSPPPFRRRVDPSPCRVLGIFGLSSQTDERDLKRLFEKYGYVERVKLVTDPRTGRSRGFAFIYYDNVESAEKAKDRVHGSDVDGCNVRVEYSISNREHNPTPGVYMGRRMGSRHDSRSRSRSRERKPSYSRD